MRLSFKTGAAVVLLGLLIFGRGFRLGGAEFYSPPDLPPLPEPFDPPTTWTDPFDPFDNPEPSIYDFPPEDPLDPPQVDPLPLPDPPDTLDPFPDDASAEQLDPFDIEPPVPLPPPDARGAGSLVTPLMPFPQRLPFPPSYTTGTKPPRMRKQCSAATSNRLVHTEGPKNRVAFLDTCPVKITARVAVGVFPVSIAITPDHSMALVANSGTGFASGSVSVIDLSTRTVTHTINLEHAAPDGSPVVPNGVVIHPDGKRAYVSSHSCYQGAFVFILDLTTFTVTGNIPVGCVPASMALTPDGSQLWVTQRADNRFDVFDTATNEHVIAFNASYPTGVTFNPTGTTAYVLQGTSPGSMLVVDTSSYKVTKSIPVGDLPHVVKVTPDGGWIFVTNALSDSISQISVASQQVVRTIPMPEGTHHPLGLAFVQ